MLKRNITLGLLVFMVGVLITACGDKNNTTTNNPVATDPVNAAFADTCENCSRTLEGTFRVLDEELYLEVFDHSIRSNFDINLIKGDSLGARLANALISPAVEIGTGLLFCKGQDIILDVLGDDIDEDCTFETGDFFDNNDDQVKSSYAAGLRINYDRGEVESVEISIDTDLRSANDQEIFFHDRSNIYENRNGSLILTNSDGRVRLATSGGRVIGEFID